MYIRHKIEQIEGIGETRARALRQLGLSTTEDLLIHSPGHLAAVCTAIPAFPLARLRKFRACAELMQIDGLSGQHAEALVRVGRTTLLRLAAGSPSTLVQELHEAVEQRWIPEAVSEETALVWQKRALTVAYTGKVCGVVETQGRPLQGAVVICGTDYAQVDATGRFWLPAVPFGPATLLLHAPGNKRFKRKISVLPGPPAHHAIRLQAGEDPVRILDEAAGDFIHSFEADDELAFVDVSLEELPDDTPLVLRYRYQDGRIRLVGILRRKVGTRIEIPRVVIRSSFVPTEAQPGAVFRWRNGRLDATPVSVRALRKEQLYTHLHITKQP